MNMLITILYSIFILLLKCSLVLTPVEINYYIILVRVKKKSTLVCCHIMLQNSIFKRYIYIYCFKLTYF